MEDSYNYRTFTLGPEETRAFDEFRERPRVGEPGADAELIDAVTEERVRLSELWKRQPLVIEFGSLT